LYGHSLRTRKVIRFCIPPTNPFAGQGLGFASPHPLRGASLRLSAAGGSHYLWRKQAFAMVE
jgi:hypothetical protein